jgi:hypothetical protein
MVYRMGTGYSSRRPLLILLYPANCFRYLPLKNIAIINPIFLTGNGDIFLHDGQGSWTGAGHPHAGSLHQVKCSEMFVSMTQHSETAAHGEPKASPINAIVSLRSFQHGPTVLSMFLTQLFKGTVH